MNKTPSIKVKLGIGALLLFGILATNFVSMWNMDHGETAHHGCVGLSAVQPTCMAIADIATCLQVHLGLLQSVSQGTPTYLSQLLFMLLAIVIVWYGLRWKRDYLNDLFHCRLRALDLKRNQYPALKKISVWLTLFKKRDPASAPLVLGFLPRLTTF